MSEDREFEKFWKVYPRKVDKQQAIKAWKKLDPDPELVETIVKSVLAQAQTHDWLKAYGEFIPYPSSWLNGKRWEDERSPDWELGMSDHDGAAELDPEVQADIERLKAKPGVAERLKKIEEAKL